MRHSKITFQEVKFYKPLILDYLSDEPNLDALYAYNPNLTGSSKALADRVKYKVDRATLVEELLSQYSDEQFNGLGKVKLNIELLKNESTFTVTTGHQLNLFGGTQYFIFKIVDTINLAKRLKEKHPENDFVPVFWMASEDHDFQEINRVRVGNRWLKWDSDSKGAVGRFNPSPVLQVINELRSFFVAEPVTGKYLEQLFEQAYSLPTLAEATRYWTHELFRDFGLVILDGDSAALKAKFKTIIKTELIAQKTYLEVEKTNAQLIANNYHIQVQPREINLFYLGNNDRQRIVPTKSGFGLFEGSKHWSAEEILKEVEEFPARFSPNALMRPMFQETVLPNLCYVGGAGEIAYWLQSRSAFDANAVFFPQLMVRNSVVYLKRSDFEKIKKLSLKVSDFFKKAEALVVQVSEQRPETEPVLNKIKEIETLIGQLNSTAEAAFDQVKVISGVFAAEKKHELKKLKQRIRKASKSKISKEMAWLHQILETLFPEGVFQERIDSFLPSYLANGKGYIANLIEHLEPFEHSVYVMEA